MAEYSADLEGVLKGSKHIADAFEGSQNILSEFIKTWESFYGWWGEEGEGDELADKLGEKHRGLMESVSETTTVFTEAVQALINAVAEQVEPLGRPQEYAIEGIDNLKAEGEARR